MRIVEINALPNGAHNNQTINGVNQTTFPVPAGWAILPESVVCENFPFGEVTVDGSVPPIVTGWTPGVIPEPETEPVEPEPAEPSVWDELDTAYSEGYQEGVNNV